MEEIWKDLKNYKGKYKVSSFGRVKRVRGFVNARDNSKRIVRERVLKQSISRKYKSVNLSSGNQRVSVHVHRLITETFIPNPKGKPCVNHIDGDKLNNNVDNLEWCTYSENTIHAFRNNLINIKSGKDSPQYGKPKLSTCKKVLDTKTGIVYFSIKDASEKLDIKISYLYQMLSGRRNNKTNLIFYNDAKTSI